jgi:hypothetical protein
MTPQDQAIQSQLDQAGKGLPKLEGAFLRHIGFPTLKGLLSWDRAMNRFESEGLKIIELTQHMSHEMLFTKVLIPKVFAIEDNSRYYSPAMVLWHLIYVGQTIEQGIIDLSHGRQIDMIIKIENFKPYVEIDDDIVSQFEKFITNNRDNITQNLGNPAHPTCHTHPWFGCLNAHGWLVMSMAHQLIHRRQIEAIIKHAKDYHAD